MLQPTPRSPSNSNGTASSNGSVSNGAAHGSGTPSSPTTTRDAILDAAGVLLGRFGYHKTTMDDLAREAGVARRTLYLHFRSKDEIFLERIDRVVDRLLTELRIIASGPGSSEERLRRMLIERVLYRFDTVRGYVQSLDEIFQALRQPYLQRREGYFTAESGLFARVLEEGARMGELTVDDPQETARAFIAATSGLIPYSLSPKELGSRRDIERITVRIADLLVGGLRKPGTRSGI